MISIKKASKNDSRLLSELATLTFIESHGSSAKPEDIHFYVSQKLSEAIFETELPDSKNNYYLVYHNEIAAGFSNIILNSPYPESRVNNIAKLERIYLLSEFYNMKLGAELFNFNVDFARKNNQQAIWLFVWKENERAINFYRKNGFVIIGSHDFKISDNHSNPNYQMLLVLC